MLIKINNCFPDQYGQDVERMLALSNILRSHGERKNIILADKTILDAIVSFEAYSRIDKIYAEDIRVCLRETGALIDILDVHLIVDFGVAGLLSGYDVAKKAIIVGYKFFVDINKANSVTFIAENELDYLLYVKIAEFYSKYTSGVNLGVKFSFCLGAGSHCKPQFDREVSENKIVLCVVDNDKKHPNKGEGATSGAFSLEDRRLSGSNLAVVLEHREIESLIPLKIMEDIVVKKIPDKVDSIDKIKQYVSRDFKFQKYFDFKEGMHLNHLIDLDNTHGEFWVDILSIDPKLRHKACFVTRQSKSCDSCASCPKIEGISENLLVFTVNELNLTNPKSIIQKLDQNLSAEWEKLGKIVMSWGCALNSGAVRA